MQRGRAVDALLVRLPPDDPDRVALQARASAYATECGCAMGGAFMAGATVLAVLYFSLAGELGVSSGAIAVAVVLVATLAGKGAGVALASLRLLLLRRSLSRKLRSERSSAYVHVH